jgi:hypothetical protein
MKTILIALLSSWCGCALAQSAQELIDNGKNSENVTTFGMGYNLNQYSPLSQIKEHEPQQRHRRIGAADNLQRRDVRGERALDVRP